MRNTKNNIGIVIIGRNEGERLKRCLTSIPDGIDSVVYVDSGSSDDSVAYAEAKGIHFVQLDMDIPFSAGRARNEGFKALAKEHTQVQHVQFIDGDCELCGDWLTFASAYLENNPTCAIVAGRRKEKFPEQSIYNLLCDIEWNTPIGEAKACGGDFMIRRDAFQQVDGFNPIVIAGEEPEMCYRLSNNKWSIFRLDHPMTMHDAAITRFSQWWKRYVRTGHAYAQGFTLHAPDGRGYCFSEFVKIWIWAFILPVSALLLAFAVNIYYLFILTVYFAQFTRMVLYARKHLKDNKQSMIYSFFTIIGRWPQFIGLLLFFKRKLFGKKFSIIEYN